MRRAFWSIPLLLVILLAIPAGVGIYHAGVNAGIDQAAKSTQVVRVVGPGYGYGWGFFPFGLLIFPLLLFTIFGLARAARWSRFGGPRGHNRWGPGPGGPGTAMAEEWHRRQHESAEEGSQAGRAGP